MTKTTTYSKSVLYGVDDSAQIVPTDEGETAFDVELIGITTKGAVSLERLEIRKELVHQLRLAPDSFFAYWQIIALEIGWRQNRDDYLLDFANMLRTWRPFVDEHRGSGRYHGSVTEFRMGPDIETLDAPLDDDFVIGHHAVRFGPVLLISMEQRVERPPLNSVIGVEGRSAF